MIIQKPKMKILNQFILGINAMDVMVVLLVADINALYAKISIIVKNVKKN